MTYLPFSVILDTHNYVTYYESQSALKKQETYMLINHRNLIWPPSNG